MKLWQEALVSLACLFVLGCRTDPNIVLLERENRELENTIYELQDCLNQYQHNLEACQRENAALQARSNGKDSTIRDAADTTPRRDSSPPPSPSRRKSTPPPPVNREELQPPQIELPPESSSSSQLPPSMSGPAKAPSGNTPAKPGDAPPAKPTPKPGPAGGAAMPEVLPLPPPDLSPPGGRAPKPGMSTHRQRVNNTSVAGIKLDPRFTGGYDQDGHGGDDGITLAIQPRDAQGRALSAVAPVSVVVLDPTQSGDAARIARWDFSAEEVAGALKESKPGEGIRLAMPWPQSPPAHGQLHLFVRYTTDDGQKLQADCPIQVALDSKQGKNWAPALLPKMNESVSQSPGSDDQQPVSAAPAAAAKSSAGPSSSRATSSAPAALEASRPTWSPNRR